MNKKTLPFLFLLICAFQQINAERLQTKSVNSYTGIYLQEITSENVAYTQKSDDNYRNLLQFDLLELEKQFSYFKKNNSDVSLLNENLNKIYEFCGVHRQSYLPYNFKYLSYKEGDLARAKENSTAILKSITDINNKVFPEEMNVVLKDRDYYYDSYYQTPRPSQQNYTKLNLIKNYIDIENNLTIVGTLRISVKVGFYEPTIFKNTDLYKIYYVPFYTDYKYDPINIYTLDSKYQKYKYILYRQQSRGWSILLEDMSECEIISDILYCHTNENKGLIENCVDNAARSSYTYGECDFAEQTVGDYDEFTSLGNGEFHFFMNRQGRKYEYSCDGYLVDKDTFGMWQGTFKMGKNCTLITSYARIDSANGTFVITRTENSRLISEEYWDDFPWDTVGIVAGSIFVAIISICLVFFVYRRIKACYSRSGRDDYDRIVGSN